jgi:hypothetical protein
LDILVYIKKNSSRAIIIKITHIIDPTIKRDISAKGLAPWLLIMSTSKVMPKIIAKTMIVRYGVRCMATSVRSRLSQNCWYAQAVLVPCRRAGVYQIMSGKEGFAMIRGSVVLFALALSGCALSTTLDTEYHDYFVIAVLSAVSAMAIMAIIHDAIEHRQR